MKRTGLKARVTDWRKEMRAALNKTAMGGTGELDAAMAVAERMVVEAQNAFADEMSRVVAARERVDTERAELRAENERLREQLDSERGMRRAGLKVAQENAALLDAAVQAERERCLSIAQSTGPAFEKIDAIRRGR